MIEHESLEDRVKRLEAELAEVKADRDKYKEQYTWMALDHLKRQPLPTQEEWDEAVRDGVSLRSVLDEWKREERDV